MLAFWTDATSAFHRKQFDPPRRIVLCCGGGSQSALAAATLQEMVYNFAYLDGGISAWKAGWRTEWGRSILVRLAYSL
jgi:rhodanese-related sulfurtransferase